MNFVMTKNVCYDVIVYTRIFEACEISGYDEGDERGRAEGKLQGLTEVAVKLLASGMSEEVVAEMTSLSQIAR